MTSENRNEPRTERTDGPLAAEFAHATGVPRRRGAARLVAPLVLTTAAVFLLIAVVSAIGTLRTPIPHTATLAPAAAPAAPAEPAEPAASPRAETSTGSMAAASGSTTAPDGASRTTRSSPTTSGPSATPSRSGDAAADELTRIAKDNENRPQGEAYAILFDLSDGTQNSQLKTESGATTWHAQDILWLYRQRTAAWPGAVLEARTDGDKGAWRLTVSNPSWRTPQDAQKWCDASFAQYDGDARSARCRVPQ